MIERRFRTRSKICLPRMARQKSSAPSGKVFDTAMRGSAFFQTKANTHIVCEAKDNGRIYDPACGSGASLPASRLCGVRFAEKDRAIAQGVVQSEKFVESHGGVAKCEVRSASVEVKTLRPFVIRNSSFDISGPTPARSTPTPSAPSSTPTSAPTGNLRMPKCECGTEKP